MRFDEYFFYLCRMKREVELAVIDNNTLACIGLRALLQELLPEATVRVFSSFADLMRDTPFGFVHYFVSYSIYFQQVEFFQQLGPRVILLVQNAEQLQRVHLPALNVSLPEAQFAGQIMQLRQMGANHAAGSFHGPDYGTRRMPHSPQLQPELSAREVEVLCLMVKGLINKEIARQLNISPTTVITHRKNLQEKTGIKSLSGLTVYAILNGYVRVEEI